MTNEEAIQFLSQIMDALLASNSWLPSTDNPIKESFCMAISALTAQADSKELSFTRNALDTISRQAAIDALWKALYEYEDKTEKQFIESEELDVADWIQHRIFVQNMSDIDRQTIRDLPSAQPERTCVNCGRTANNGGWYADGRTRCPIEEHYALPKDGYCHLWEERNVTDDDYPERRTDE